MKKLITVCLLMMFAVGCNKLKGEKGDKGDAGLQGLTGDSGTVIVTYEGTLASGSYWVSVPTLITKDVVTVLYSPIGILAEGEWVELGSPTGQGSLTDPFCVLNYNERKVYMYNLDAFRYKIMVTKNYY